MNDSTDIKILAGIIAIIVVVLVGGLLVSVWLNFGKTPIASSAVYESPTD